MGSEDRLPNTNDMPSQIEPWRDNTSTIYTVIPANLVPEYANMARALECWILQDRGLQKEVDYGLRERDADALSKLAKVLEYIHCKEPEGEFLTFNAPFALSMTLMRRQSDWRDGSKCMPLAVWN